MGQWHPHWGRSSPCFPPTCWCPGKHPHRHPARGSAGVPTKCQTAHRGFPCSRGGVDLAWRVMIEDKQHLTSSWGPLTTQVDPQTNHHNTQYIRVKITQ
jgi:hypothetical protein